MLHLPIKGVCSAIPVCLEAEASWNRLILYAESLLLTVVGRQKPRFFVRRFMNANRHDKMESQLLARDRGSNASGYHSLHSSTHCNEAHPICFS